MRKFSLFVIVLTLCSHIFAQDPEHPEMYIGATFGPTGSVVMFNPTVKQTFLLGYNGGIMYRFISDKGLGLQAELNWSQRGWSESGNLYARQLNYIEIPFMSHFYLGSKNRFFFNIGPKISYLISEKVLTDNTSGSTNTQYVTNVQNPLDYGLCGGFGLIFNVSKLAFQLDSRVNYSLSDIFSNVKGASFANSNNFNIAINLGLLLRVK